jgi:hypothetical protein
MFLRRDGIAWGEAIEALGFAQSRANRSQK